MALTTTAAHRKDVGKIEIAHSFGEQTLYAGDDGSLYLS